MSDIVAMSDVDIAKGIKSLLTEAERRYPDSQPLKAAHECLNRAARELLRADAAQVGVYPLARVGAVQTAESPPTSGKGSPPPP